MIIPNIWENKTWQPNHQPELVCNQYAAWSQRVSLGRISPLGSNLFWWVDSEDCRGVPMQWTHMVIENVATPTGNLLWDALYHPLMVGFIGLSHDLQRKLWIQQKTTTVAAWPWHLRPLQNSFLETENLRLDASDGFASNKRKTKGRVSMILSTLGDESSINETFIKHMISWDIYGIYPQ